MPDESHRPNRDIAPLAESLPDDDLVIPHVSKAVPGKTMQGHRTQFQNDPEVDAVLRQYSLERVRGDKYKAEKMLRDALTLHPTAGALHESLGDLLAERGQSKEAISCYRRAQSCGGGPAIESKIGRIALKQDTHLGGLTGNIVEHGAGPVAIIASALIPGLGLALVGDFQNAAITFGGWIIPIALMSVIPQMNNAFQAMRGKAIAPPWETFVFIFIGLISTAFWAYSLYLTAQVSKSAEKDGS